MNQSDLLTALVSAGESRPLESNEIASLNEIWSDILTRAGCSVDLSGHEEFVRRMVAGGKRIPVKLIGLVDWYIYGEYWINEWGGAFNGQASRLKIFQELVKAGGLSCVIETGTYRGDTTIVIARESRVPVYTTELNPRCYEFSKQRLYAAKDLQIYQLDSRVFINKLAQDPYVPKERAFFYLDAHWGKDLPLRDEVRLIADVWSDTVIMIDDFRVPGDDGYNYDDYGDGFELCLDYLQLDKCSSLEVYWPGTSSAQETGRRRGCVILATPGYFRNKPDVLKTLRRHEG